MSSVARLRNRGSDIRSFAKSHWARGFTGKISFNHHSNPRRKGLSPCPFYRRGNWGFRRGSNLKWYGSILHVSDFRVCILPSPACLSKLLSYPCLFMKETFRDKAKAKKPVERAHVFLLSSFGATLGTSETWCSPGESEMPEHTRINHTRLGPLRGGGGGVGGAHELLSGGLEYVPFFLYRFWP